MRVGDLGAAELHQRCRHGALVIQTGPFSFRVRSDHALLREGLALLYAHYPVADVDDFADFQVEIAPGAGWRQWVRPQSVFQFDGRRVFEPLPAAHAYPLLEWAMNWCISTQSLRYLTIHAAVLERNGHAMVMPAPSGSGKSTLCAALLHAGWRLLSDELALVDLDDGLVHPLCRPVSLKNQSVPVIRALAPDAVFSRATHDTMKGSVSHMKVPDAHLDRVHVPARARWIVYPRYEPGAPTTLTSHRRASAVVDLAKQSFNFNLLGVRGFETLTGLVRACHCHDFRYSALPEAIDLFNQMADAAPSP
jgi:HprK-related kinase A